MYLDGHASIPRRSKCKERRSGWPARERGQRSRDKVIRIEGLSEHDARRRLLGQP